MTRREDVARLMREEAARSTDPEIAAEYAARLAEDDEAEALLDAVRERTGRKGLSDG